MPKLRKELSLLGVYAIATGTTLSAGFFLLPSFAAVVAGPSVILAYLLAGVMLVPPMLCAVELATAMPRSGGAYYFLDRSLGPLAGTIGGLGTWLALMLKTAFALVGMGAYIALFLPPGLGDWIYVAIGASLAAFFGFVNLFGAKKSGGMQIVLVVGLLTILTAFIGSGIASIEPANIQGVFDIDLDQLLSTTGMVFISYVGVTKVASVAEEVRRPEQDLPRGVFLALSTAVLIYALGLTVMVGVVGSDLLAASPAYHGQPDLTPAASAAAKIGVALTPGSGRWAQNLVAVAALLAFSSVANAGILSASRYPLAMSRDRLIPRVFSRVSKQGAPVVGVAMTTMVVIALVFLEPMKIAKLASAFQLLMFGLLCLAVIVMRESEIESYDPGYKSPFYPWLHIIGILTPVVLIVEMGWLPSLFTASLIGLGSMWYHYYGSSRVVRTGAIYHVFERLGRRRFHGLDGELRSILKEKGLRDEDPFDRVVARAAVIDAPERSTFAGLVAQASQHFARHVDLPTSELENRFMQGTRVGATPVSKAVALPHLRLPDLESPILVIARISSGVDIEVGSVLDDSVETKSVRAIFFLLSPDSDAGQHLRILAQIAGRVEQPEFVHRWDAAHGSREITAAMLSDERLISVTLAPDTPCSKWIGKALATAGLPEGCLVALVHRGPETIVPSGKTLLQAGDVLTILGEADAILKLREDTGLLPPAPHPTIDSHSELSGSLDFNATELGAQARADTERS